jgi:hypothetical protein
MDPVLTPVLAVHDELEVAPEQRVEPVGHPDAAIPIVGVFRGVSHRVEIR